MPGNEWDHWDDEQENVSSSTKNSTEGRDHDKWGDWDDGVSARSSPMSKSSYSAHALPSRRFSSLPAPPSAAGVAPRYVIVSLFLLSFYTDRQCNRFQGSIRVLIRHYSK